MTAVVALDLSTKTGWALLNDKGMPTSFGLITKGLDWKISEYPENFILISEEIAEQVASKVEELLPEISNVVIECVNKPGRFGSRFSQQVLDFIHFCVIKKLLKMPVKIHYVNTSDWRKTLKLSVAETKKAAKPILKEFNTLKKAFEAEPDRTKKKELGVKLKDFKELLKKRCIHGSIDKKSISVAYCNATWSLDLKKGDNDIADAMCQARAWQLGCPVIDNSMIFDTYEKK